VYRNQNTGGPGSTVSVEMVDTVLPGPGSKIPALLFFPLPGTARQMYLAIIIAVYGAVFPLQYISPVRQPVIYPDLR